jgi:hypothetical protein
MAMPLPRFVVAKPLKNGRMGFYWYVTLYYRHLGCSIPNEPLGTDYTAACGRDGTGGKAAILNAQFDEWTARRRGEPMVGRLGIPGVQEQHPLSGEGVGALAA